MLLSQTVVKIFRIFKMAAVRHLGFLEFNILTTDTVRRVNSYIIRLCSY